MRMIDQILTQLISIHALHEESDYPVSARCEQVYISIHALHEESDVEWLPVLPHFFPISIHALHEESDSEACRHGFTQS